MSTRLHIRRTLASLAAGLLALAGAQLMQAPYAAACGGRGEPSCSGGDTSSGSGSDTSSSSGTVQATYTSVGSNSQSCSVYANGIGMGAYCITGGIGTLKTLHERFGGMTWQQCRYREVPDGLPVPYNARPDEGRYMLQICLQNINWDSYSGGKDRMIRVDVVFVPNGTDIKDNNNPLNTFLWQSAENAQRLPVPFLHPRPNITPVVGVPTFFTFHWIDPSTREPVRDPNGPYADSPKGGPFKRIVTEGGMIMEAQATDVSIDMRQRDMEKIHCRPDTPYIEGAPASAQPAGGCKFTFPRSAASAREFSRVPIPQRVQDAYYSFIEVTYRVRYGTPGAMQELGDGFKMRLSQAIPVQEIQAPNQPPTVIY